MADSASAERKGSGSASSKKRGSTKATAAASSTDSGSATQRAAKAQRKAQRAEAAAATSEQAQRSASAHGGDDGEDDSAGIDADGVDHGSSGTPDEEEQQSHDDSDEDESETDVSTPEGMQAMLVALMKQQKQAKAAAKAERVQDRALIAQLQAQLQQQATSAVRLGTSFSTGVLAPAARSTLKAEAGVLAQQQTAAAAAAAASPETQQRAEEARSPGAPGVQAAALAAPPRRELPKVKQELEAAALSKDPTLLKAWVFQMERLLRAMEQGSAQAFTFGDRLSVAQDHWDAGIEAWWTSLCDARAAAMSPSVCSWAGLIAALHETYAPVSDALAAAREMHQIKQGASESMEAYVRRVLELQGRVPPGRLPSHVIGDLALNGVDESRFPWTLSIVRGEAAGYANTQASGQGPDMAFIAHRLRTQAASEPKVSRGAGSSNAELVSIKAELARMQRQLAQSAQAAHTAALYTAGSSGDNHSSSSSSSSSSSTSGQKADRSGWRGVSGRGRGTRGGRGGGASTRQPLDDAELNRRYEAGLCFECGKDGHIGRDCPKRAAKKQQQLQQQQNERGAEGAPSSGN